LAVKDERKAIDMVVTQLRQLTEELKIGLILISHLTKADGGKSHEEGEPIKLRDARGSQAIAQLSDVVIALERNQQEEDIYLRNLIRVRILKNRPWRKTGVVCKLYYDNRDGTLTDYPADHMEDTRDEFDDLSGTLGGAGQVGQIQQEGPQGNSVEAVSREGGEAPPLDEDGQPF